MLDRLSDGIGSIVEGKGTEVTNWYTTDTYRIMDMDTLDEFNQKLIDNGIEAYIGEKQRQLDEWLKQNK